MTSLAESVAELLRRQEQLEARISILEGQPPATSAVPPPPGHVRTFQPSKKVALETKVGLTLINRIGVITLVLGVAFFFKWAADSNWIGPSEGVALGILAGLATLFVADLLWRKAQRAFAQGISGTGIAVLYVVVYSGFGLYHLFPRAFAFPLLFSVTAVAFALSLRYDSPAVTSLGLVGGYLTPILVSAGEDHPWYLFSYVFLLDAAAIILAKKRTWRVLEFISVFATLLIYGIWLISLSKQPQRVLATVTLFVFYGLFSQVSEPIVFLIVQGLAALAIASIGQGSPAVFFCLALPLAAGGLTYAERRRFPYMLSAACGSFWLSYALWDLLETRSFAWVPFCGITLAFLLFFCWNAWLLTRTRELPSVQPLSLIALNGVVYYAAACELLFATHGELLFLLAIAIAAVCLAIWWKLKRSHAALWDYFAGQTVLLWGLILELLTWIRRYMPPQSRPSAETLSISVLLAAYALILVGAGVATRTAVNRLTGLVLIGLVIVKLYLFDVWQLQRPYRISAFIALGFFLISTSFLYSRFRPLIESLLKNDETTS